MYSKHHVKDFVLGIMVGSTVGALSAMMYTTKKGHAIKRAAKVKYHEIENFVQKAVQNKGKVFQAAKKIRRKVARKAKKFTR